MKKAGLNLELLKKNKVGLAVVFGSKISKTSHPLSDIDVGIVFEDERLRKKDPVDVYGDIYEIFREYFDENKIDVVYLRDVPLSLQFKAISKGKTIYSVTPEFLANYKEEVMNRYFDFQHIENIFNRAFLGQKT